VHRLQRAIDYSEVTVEDTGALHALASDGDQVDVGRPDVEYLVQGDVRLDVIGRRRRKPGRYMEQAEGQLQAALGDWAYD
jgi:hypothetical protein